MATFLLNCEIESPGERNFYGQSVYVDRRSGCLSVLKFVEIDDKTSVRTDSSASRSFAKEKLVIGEFIMPLNSVDEGDLIHFDGQVFEVTSTHKRWDASGRPDHIEVTAKRAPL